MPTTNKNIHLSLNGDYASQILSTFLWREPSAPDASKIIDSKYTELGAGKTVAFSAREYMNAVGNKFVKANPFGVFEKFFGSKHEDGSSVTFNTAGLQANANGEYELTHQQLIDRLYKIGGVNHKLIQKPQLDLKHYYWDVDSADYAKRAFTFGSSKLTFNAKDDTDGQGNIIKGVRYIVDKNGKPLRIDNLKISPMDTYDERDEKGNVIKIDIKENFDFNSTDGMAKHANQLLSPMTDPSGIGQKVEITFIKDVQPVSLTKAEFDADSQNQIYKDLRKKYNNKEYDQEKYINELQNIRNSHVFDFLTADKKPVVFGSKEDDTIKGLQAPNNDMSKPELGHLITE